MKPLKILMLMVLAAFSSIHAHDHGNFKGISLFSTMQPGDKAALLMVHFGTSHEDTRALTIDKINQKAKESFPELEVRQAWTSRIILRKMKERGVHMPDPVTALQQLRSEGYTHILVQSSNIIEGIEMESLRREVAEISPVFKDIRIGNPLLYTPDDYKAVIEALIQRVGTDKTVVFVGHGTYTPATAQYAMLDYMLKEKGYSQLHVGTVEGYPGMEEVVAQLSENGAKEVILLPFMFVAGDHAKNDIAGEWKEELEKEGFQVSVLLEGLGENPGIQDLFMEHILFMTGHKMLDIRGKKERVCAGKRKILNKPE